MSAEPPIDIPLNPPTGSLGFAGHPPAVISLKEEAAKEGLTVDDGLRKQIAPLITWTLIGGNIVTLIVIAILVSLDQYNLTHTLISAGDRIINHQVVMALLGATTIQVGTIAAIIARYLFPGRST